MEHYIGIQKARQYKANLEKLSDLAVFSKLAAVLDTACPCSEYSKEDVPLYPTEIMLRVLFLQALYTWSNEETEQKLIHWGEFQRFCFLHAKPSAPDPQSIILFKKRLAQSKLSIPEIFEAIDRELQANECVMREAQYTYTALKSRHLRSAEPRSFSWVTFAVGAWTGFVGLLIFNYFYEKIDSIPTIAPPPSPLLRPFGDNKDWIVNEDLVYRIGDTADYIVVPRGFVTDFASIPQALWSFGLSPHGQYSRAAVIHDYLYWTQGCHRNQADRLMIIAMNESEVGGFDELAIYTGVNIGGESAWRSNTQEREVNGLPKIIPDKYIRPENPNTRWPEYRQYLLAQGVRDPIFDPSPIYCKYGDTTQVPKASERITLSRE